MRIRPLVSVIIPVLNASRQLPDLMEALSRQTWPAEQTEIILVDNGSDDNTVDIAARYPVKMLRETGNRSPYAARNLGINSSRGEVIALLDANKIPEPLWIESGVNALVSQKADLAGGAIHFRLSDDSTAGEIADGVLFNNNRDLVKRNGGSVAGNLFIRREVWAKCGPFPPQFRSGMDIWWTLRAMKQGFRLVYAPGAVTWCIPRRAGHVIRKGYRVGKVHPATMRADGFSLPSVFFHALRTFLPPRPGLIRTRMSELVPGAPGRMVVSVFTVLWLTRIAMAAGRLRGLFVTVEVPGRRRVGFLYYTFFPVFGGASVHGYNLARELSRLGYELWKLNGDPDDRSVLPVHSAPCRRRYCGESRN